MGWSGSINLKIKNRIPPQCGNQSFPSNTHQSFLHSTL
uniref:Uncharacterized protein n=1 Tax=Rhizophora mucronata TaxID=61149 RepID=A0A2P2IYD1_RHIMU